MEQTDNVSCPGKGTDTFSFGYATLLTEQAGGGLVRTISRTLAVWDSYRKVPFEFSDAFIATLISKEETKVTEATAKRAHRFNSNIDASVEILI